MTEKVKKTIHIKWVRSGIGFPRAQKTRIKSLGLGRLNQVVERPDTPQMSGLVESIPHLVEIVDAPAKPAWMLVPEVTILPPDPAAAPAPKPVTKPKPVETEEVPTEKGEVEAKPAKAAAHAEHAKKEKKPAKAAAKSKKEDKEKKSKAAKAKPAKKSKK